MSDANTEPTTHLLDVEPEVFRGVSNSEFKAIIGVALIIGAILALMVALTLTLLTGLFSLIFIQIPLMLILALGIAFWMIKRVGVEKRGKPDFYFVHKLRLSRLVRALSKCPYITYVGSWSVERGDTSRGL